MTIPSGFIPRTRTGDHKHGWAIDDLHNGAVKTCADAFTRDGILNDMAKAGVPLPKIHIFQFTEHRQPDLRIGLSAPLTGWL